MTLTIHNCVVDDQGEYTIQLFNEYGVSEFTTTVIIDFEFPSFTQPLKDVPTSINQTATFECKVAGRPKPETKWLICGMELGESEKYHMEREDMTARMSLNYVTLDDCEMTYTCNAHNAAGQVESSANLVPQGAWQDLYPRMTFMCAAGVLSQTKLPTRFTATLVLLPDSFLFVLFPFFLLF